MAPKRQQPAQPQRRSTRIASRASSAAASESAEHNDVLTKLPARKSKTAAQSKKAQANLFDAAVVIEKIMRGNLAIVKTLTDEEVSAVITGFRSNQENLEERVRSLEDENERIRAERDEANKAAAKRLTIRDAFYRDRMNATREKIVRERAEQQGSQTPATEKVPETPTDKQRKPVQAETAPAKILSKPSFDVHPPSPPSTSSPAHAASSPAVSDGQQLVASTPKSRPSILGRVFSTIASPFSSFLSPARRPVQAHTSQEVPHQPLGELSSNRKRRAEEPAPEDPSLRLPPTTSSTPQPARTPRHFNTVPSARNPVFPSTLKTIAERSELSEESIMPEPTPSRAPRSVTKMRREAREQEKMSKTPGRAWTYKPTPREPNADARLEKLRHFRELNSQLDLLKEDEELKEMVQRPVKRVKIDKLVSIPHNRPGDPSSTFRVYDVDSDDEMEVDADEQVRDNIFEMQPTQSTEASSALATAEPAQIVQTAKIVQPAVEKATPAPAPAPEPPRQKEVFVFPSVGKDGPTWLNQPRDPAKEEMQLAKFRYHFLTYQNTGVLLPW